MSSKWSDLSLAKKIGTIALFVACAGILTGCILTLTNVFKNDIITDLSFCLFCVSNVITNWDTSRKTSYIFIALAVVFAALVPLKLILA